MIFENDNIQVEITWETDSNTFPLMRVRPARGKVIPDLFWFIKTYFKYFAELLSEHVPMGNYKIGGKVLGRFEQFNTETGAMKWENTWLSTNTYVFNNDFNETMNQIASELAQLYAKWSGGSGSGWFFERLLEFQVRLARYRLSPRRGSCLTAPELPEFIPKRAVITINRVVTEENNIGANCFQDAVLVGALYAREREGCLMDINERKRKTNRPDHWNPLVRTYCADIGFHKDLAYTNSAIDVSSTYLLENENPGLFLLIMGILESKAANDVFVERTFKPSLYFQALEDFAKDGGSKRKPYIVIILLWKGHFYPVRSLEALLRRHKTHQRHYYCYVCLQYFTSKDLRDLHMKDCAIGTLQPYLYEMPSPEKSKLNFKKFAHTCQLHPFTIYADIESYHDMMDDHMEAGEEYAEEEEEPVMFKKKKIGGTIVESVQKPYLAAYVIALVPNFESVIKSWRSTRGQLNERCLTLFPEYPDNLYQQFQGENLYIF